MVGYATFQDDGDGCFEADGYVHRDRFGQGIGALIVGLTERRAAEQLEAVEQPRVVIQNAVLHVDRAASPCSRLVATAPCGTSCGCRWTCRRRHRRHCGPNGVSVTQFRPDEDLAAVHACVHEAFAHEWSFRHESVHAWQKRKLEDPRFDTSLWAVARDGGEVCGVALCDRRAVRDGVRELPRRATGLAAARAGAGAPAPGIHVVLGARRAPRGAGRRFREPDGRAAPL